MGGLTVAFFAVRDVFRARSDPSERHKSLILNDVPGVPGVPGSRPRARARVRACGRGCARPTRAHPPERPEHMEQMNKIKDLQRSEVAEQPAGARNTASGVAQRLTRSAFARLLGVHKSNVTRGVQAGRVLLDADGLVLVAQSLERWRATAGPRLDVAERHAAARAAAAQPASQPSATPDRQDAQQPAGAAIGSRLAPDPYGAASDALAGGVAAGEGSGDVPGSLRAAAEADRLRWQSATLELSLALTRGTRIPRPALLREGQGVGNAFRAAIERLIDQTAPRLAAAGADAAEQRRIVAAELAIVRRQLRAEFAAAARRLRPDGTVSGLGHAAVAAARADAADSTDSADAADAAAANLADPAATNSLRSTS